jgi:hypothetical protein
MQKQIKFWEYPTVIKQLTLFSSGSRRYRRCRLSRRNFLSLRRRRRHTWYTVCNEMKKEMQSASLLAFFRKIFVLFFCTKPDCTFPCTPVENFWSPRLSWVSPRLVGLGGWLATINSRSNDLRYLRRKIRLTESNAKCRVCRSLKNLRDFAAGVYLSEAPPPPRFLFGVVR